MHIHSLNPIYNTEKCNCFCVDSCGCECLRLGLVTITNASPGNVIPPLGRPLKMTKSKLDNLYQEYLEGK